MKSKREVLKLFTTDTCVCHNEIQCSNCPYGNITCNLRKRLINIGAMAILRMFREKKKPLLSVGTNIKFDNGEIATVFRDEVNTRYVLDFVTRFELMEYLIGRTWEVVE